MSQAGDRRASILVVDDEESVVSLLEKLLSGEGYSVRTAQTGQDAIALAKERRPDIIIMDIMMPDMDGYEATRSLKQDPQLNSTPVIFLSGKPVAEDGGRAFAEGALTYIRKPFTNRQILDLLSLALQSLPNGVA
ncbi:MAG: response regulator [candidate division Zixibacteria bacterium]|nr:response regulator [candidate division Zixibacteria bacterium]